MNKSVVFGGALIIIALIIALVYVSYDSISAVFSNATSTPVTVGGNGGNDDSDTGSGGSVAGVPVVTTNATVAQTDTTAVVTGTVIPRGAVTTYWYEYGASTGLGTKTAEQVVGSGYSAIPTPGYITGLTKGTTYYFRLMAKNQYGQVTGTQYTVTTLTSNTTAFTGDMPIAQTQGPTNVTKVSAVLNAEVNPRDEIARYWFEYGTSNSLGNITPITSIGDGTATLNASAPLVNLKTNTTYFYRVNAQNRFGTVNGAILTFKTK